MITYKNLSQRIVAAGFAFIVALGTVTASTSLMFAADASAAIGYGYTSVSLDSAAWQVDRQAPSGGWSTNPSAGTVSVAIDQAASSMTTFNKTEGISTATAAGANSVKGSFVVKSEWTSIPELRVGLWGVTDAPTGWPIVEYAANVGGYTGWRVWNTVSGGWANVVAPTSAGSYEVEISLNKTTNKFNFYINGTIVSTMTANGSQSFVRMILNHYNAGSAPANNYTVEWSGLRAGTAPVTPVTQPCSTLTPVVSYDLTQWAPTDTRTAGHNLLTADGLRVYTDNASSEAKATGYRAVDYPLAANGSQTIAESITWVQNSGTHTPGLQLVVDFDANGTPDGILVGEAVYGNNWWLTNSAAQFAKDNAPNIGGGYGSLYYGTIDQWLTAFPVAQVKGAGYSLGSGVHADGIIKNMTFGCTVYTFTNVVPQPPVTPIISTSPTVTGSGSTFTATTAAASFGTETEGVSEESTEEVLGAQSETAAIGNNTDDQETLGASTEAEDTAVWSIFGLAWYWWIPILAAAGGSAWWLTTTLRRQG